MATRSVDVIIRARDQASRQFGLIGRSAQGLGRTFLSLKNMVIGALGGVAATALIRQTLDAFGEEEAAARKLADALAILGAGGEAAMGEMKAFAAEMQRLTVHADEAVMEVMSLGASVGRLSGQALRDATRAAIGLAERLHIDLEPAMLLVAKAAQGNTATLSRYGVKLDETLSAQQKFAEVLRMGAESFALAEGQAGTYRGQMAQLKNAFSEVAEVIGAALAPAIAEITRTIRELLLPTLQGFSDQLGPWVKNTLRFFRDLMEGIKSLGVILATTFEWAWARVKATAAVALAGIFRTIQVAILDMRRLGHFVASGDFLKGKLPKLLGPGSVLGAVQAEAERQAEEMGKKGLLGGLGETVSAALAKAFPAPGPRKPKKAEPVAPIAEEEERGFLPWAIWGEGVKEALVDASDKWLARINEGLGEAAAPERVGRPAFLEQRFLKFAPGTDPVLVEAKKASTQRAKQLQVQEQIRDVLADRSTLPWADANLAGGGALPW